MKEVVYTRLSANALRKHANRAKLIRSKIEQYAADPASLANNVTELVRPDGRRLRIGDFRVLFTETETAIIVDDIAPRGSIYE